MKGIAQVQQRIRARQTFTQFTTRHPHATHSRQFVHVIWRRLMKQAITSLQAMLAQASPESANARFIFAHIGSRWEKLEPDSVKTEPAQAEHPLQRHGKIPATLRIFRRESAAEKDRHRVRSVSRGSFRIPNQFGSASGAGFALMTTFDALASHPRFPTLSRIPGS